MWSQAVNASGEALAVVAVLGVPQDEALDEQGAPIQTFKAARAALEGGKVLLATGIKEELMKRKCVPAARDFPLMVETPHNDFRVARENILVALKVVLNTIRPHQVSEVSASPCGSPVVPAKPSTNGPSHGVCCLDRAAPIPWEWLQARATAGADAPVRDHGDAGGHE
jgi:hypothetical protein